MTRVLADVVIINGKTEVCYFFKVTLTRRPVKLTTATLTGIVDRGW